MIDTDFCSNSLVHTSLGQRNVSMAAKATSAAVAADAAVRVFDVSVDGASGGAAATADPRSLLTASEEGSKLFRSVGKEPVATVSVIGAAREGKSTLMNTLLGKSNVFKVSHRSETCTQGIHVSTTLPKWSTFAGDAWTSRSREPVVALIDSEGGGCKGEAYDMQIVTPTIILSDCVILNLFGRPQPAAVADKLGTLALSASRVTSDLADDDDDDAAGPMHGHLHIVFRDYALEIDDPSKPEGSADAVVNFETDAERAGAVVRDWYLALGDSEVKKVKATWKKNRPGSHNFSVDLKQQEQLESARTRILNNFASVHVWLLPNATTDGNKFNAHVASMRSVITKQLATTTSSGAGPWSRRSTGNKIAALLPAIAEAVNSGAEELPIDSMYESALKAEAKRAVSQAVAAFETAAAAVTSAASVEEVLAAFNGLAAEANAALQASLASVSASKSLADAAGADLRKELLEAGQAAFRSRAAQLTAASTKVTTGYLGQVKALVDVALAASVSSVAADSSGVVTAASPTGARLALTAAAEALRAAIAAKHKAALRDYASAADASIVGALQLADVSTSAARGGAGTSAATAAVVFETAHAAALAAAGSAILKAVDAEVLTRTEQAVDSLAERFAGVKDAWAAAKQKELAEARRQEEEARKAAEAARAAAEEQRRLAAERAEAAAARAKAAEAEAEREREAAERERRAAAARRESDDLALRLAMMSMISTTSSGYAGGGGYSGGGYSVGYSGGGGYSGGAAAAPAPSFTPTHLKKDGTLDMRFRDSKDAVARGLASRDTKYRF